MTRRPATGDDTAAARAGDADAFERLVRANDDRMRALAFRMLGSRSAMDDALQEAYLKAFRKVGGFRGDSAFATWLHRIVATTCIDHARQASRRSDVPLAEDPEVADPVSKPSGHVDRVGDAVAGRTDLQRALDRLSPDYRAALLLVDGEGMSYDEASEILDVPPGTVASRLNRARRTMRDLLDIPEDDR